MATENTDPPWLGWVILELMGHGRRAGLLTEQQIGGVTFLRIDVPSENGPGASQFYSVPAVYCITPTTEETARRVATITRVAPVELWELPTAEAPDDGGPF